MVHLRLGQKRKRHKTNRFFEFKSCLSKACTAPPSAYAQKIRKSLIFYPSLCLFRSLLTPSIQTLAPCFQMYGYLNIYIFSGLFLHFYRINGFLKASTGLAFYYINPRGYIFIKNLVIL